MGQLDQPQKFLVFELSREQQQNSPFLLQQVQEAATSIYACDGVCDLVMNENEVDELLGAAAYCGGNLPDEVVAMIDQQASNDAMKIYFWGHHLRERGQRFADYLQQASVVHQQKWESFDDWNQTWKQHFRPLVIDPTLTIVPSWYQDQDQDQDQNRDQAQKVYINPGMGFGTGEHQTTRMCLQIMLEHHLLAAGQGCLDFGCGSGILGIVAIKLGKMWVDFCDIDRNALDNCLDNLQINFAQQDLTGNRLVGRERFVFGDQSYQLILANILLPVLQAEAPQLINALALNGKLVISGILVEQEEELLQYYSLAQGMRLVSKRQLGDWSGLLLERWR